MVSRQDSPTHVPWLQISLVVVVGVAVGIAFVGLPPLWVVGGLVAIGFGFAIIKRPEIGLLGILFVTSSIIFEETLPLTNVGIGSLHISDIILIVLLGLIVVRWMAEPGFRIVGTPLDLPLLVFLGLAVVTSVLAILNGNAALDLVRRNLRQIMYWLTFFIVTNLVRDRRQLQFLLKGLFLLGTLVALAMIAQVILGDSVNILPGVLGTLDVAGTSIPGTTRIVPPGRSLIIISFVALISVLSTEKLSSNRVWSFLQWFVLGIGVVLTYLRSYWVGIIIAVLLLAWLNRGEARRRLMGWGLAVLIILSIAVLAFNSLGQNTQATSLANGFLARFATLVNGNTLSDPSLQYRGVENDYALAQIAAHPLIGLGLGASYRPYDPRIDSPGENYDPTTFIHNGHLWVMLFMGIPTYLAVLWLSFVFLYRGFKYWRKVPDPETRAIVLSFTVSYVGILIATMVNQTFGTWLWTPLLGIMMGVNEIVFQKAINVPDETA